MYCLAPLEKKKQIARFARDNNGVTMNDHSLLPTRKRNGV